MYKIRYTQSLIMLLLFTAILFVVAAPVPASADPQTVIKDLDQAYVQIAQKVSPAVVRVSSTKNVSVASDEGLEPFLRQLPFFGDQFPKQFRNPQSREMLMGSGFIVSPDGLIMTNYHVVKDMKEIKVTLAGRRDYKAKLVGADPESDIALIKTDAKDLPTVAWGDSSKLQVGEIVVAIGNPFGLSGSVTNGIVSATGRTNMGIIGYEDFIQTDAPINPGNSGGPLVNIKGKVVGVNTAIASQSGGYMGVGFTIPSNSAKLIMDELLEHGKVEHGFLGINIQDVDEALAKSFGRTEVNGALVSQVVHGSPADKAGIRAGDIVMDYNGKPVIGAAQLKNLVGQAKPGATATLTIWRDKKATDINVNISERTAKAVNAAVPAAKAAAELGITLEKAPPQLASKLGVKNGEGLVIQEENPDGRGAAMGLRPGDVILQVDDKPITDVADFNKEVMEAKKEGVIRFMIQRGSATIFLAENFS